MADDAKLIAQHYEQRFDKLEDKLDKLVDAIDTLARVEERQVAANKRVDRIEWRQDQMDAHVRQLAEVMAESTSKLRLGERVVWAAGSMVTALIAAVLGQGWLE